MEATSVAFVALRDFWIAYGLAFQYGLWVGEALRGVFGGGIDIPISVRQLQAACAVQN